MIQTCKSVEIKERRRTCFFVFEVVPGRLCHAHHHRHRHCNKATGRTLKEHTRTRQNDTYKHTFDVLKCCAVLLQPAERAATAMTGLAGATNSRVRRSPVNDRLRQGLDVRSFVLFALCFACGSCNQHVELVMLTTKTVNATCTWLTCSVGGTDVTEDTGVRRPSAGPNAGPSASTYAGSDTA